MALLSKNWYRVEKLKPRLKPQVEISPHVLRGKRGYALRDPVSGAIQLYSEQAYAVLGLMDGERTLDDIWLAAGELLQDDPPTQEDVIALISSLYQLDMLYLDVPANASDLFTRGDDKKVKKRIQKVYSPLSVQIPLFDPTRLLDLICPLLDRIIGRPALALYLVTVAFGLIVAGQNMEALTHNAADRILAADNLLLLWVLYPVIKIIHELGHAYAVRRYGGHVHEVGVMFLALFPMPYVNASESAAFSSKYQRITVAAAGLLVELFIAAIAVVLWSMASEGLVKSILYNVAFMAGVSSVLFNGNPLLKFDAYYVLSDYIEIPNLAKKATEYWGYLLKKYVYRFHEIEDPCGDTRERYWLFFYNLFSFTYRILISIAIILFIGSQYFVVGVLLGVWTAISSWIVPLVKTVSKPFREPQFASQSRHPILITLTCMALVAVLLFQLPLPSSYTAAGVSWPRPDERLYAGEAGFVSDIQAVAGSRVGSGQTLLGLTSYELQERLAIVDAQQDEAKARLRSVYQDRTKTGLATADLNRFQEERAEIEAALAKALVKTETEGLLVIPEAASLTDRYLRRGEVVGYVLNSERPLTIRVVLDENHAEQVLAGVQNVSVRSASDRHRVVMGRLSTVVPRITKEIPSGVLSTLGGGEIVVDPSAPDQLQALENYVVLEVEVDTVPMTRIFERYYVRFDLPPAPLFERLYRQIRQVFIKKFNV